jgi:hypothetical protein
MATGIEVPEGHPPISGDGQGCLPDGHSPVDGYEYCNEIAEDDDKVDDKPSGSDKDPSGGNDPNEGGGRPSVEGDPVYLTYHDGRRGNSGQGLYYVGGTHRIGLAEYGLEAMSGMEPKSFIPLWMNDNGFTT